MTVVSFQWCIQGQNVKAKAWTLKAKGKVVGREAGACKHRARAEMKTRTTSDS